MSRASRPGILLEEEDLKGLWFFACVDQHRSAHATWLEAGHERGERRKGLVVFAKPGLDQIHLGVQSPVGRIGVTRLGERFPVTIQKEAPDRSVVLIRRTVSIGDGCEVAHVRDPS